MTIALAPALAEVALAVRTTVTAQEVPPRLAHVIHQLENVAGLVAHGLALTSSGDRPSTAARLASVCAAAK